MPELSREEICERVTDWCARYPHLSLGATEDLVYARVCQYGQSFEEIAAAWSLAVKEVQAAWENLTALAETNP